MANIPASLIKRFLDATAWVETVGRNLVIPQPLAPPPGPGISFIHGKIDSTIEAGGSGTLSRWWLDNSGVEVDSGLDYTVYDWQFYGYPAGTHAIAHRDVTSTLNSGAWYLDPPIAAYWTGKANQDTEDIDQTLPQTAKVVGLDVTIDFRHDIWTVDASNDTLQIDKTATFDFSWSGNWEMSLANRHFHAFLQVNDGLGWLPVDQPTIRSHEHGSAAGSPEHAYDGSAIVEVVSGYLYRVAAFVSSGTAIVDGTTAYQENTLDVHEIL